MDEQEDNLAENVEAENASQEQMISQEQLNKVVTARAARAAEKARAEEQAKYAQQIEALKQQTQSMGGMQQEDPEAILQQLEQRVMDNFAAKQRQLEQQQKVAEAKKVADTYFSKMEEFVRNGDEELVKDFESTMGSFDPSAFPDLVRSVSQMDNAAQVMYELNKNPNKLVTIDNLYAKSPQMAEAMLKRLADSINYNDAAKQAHGDARPPLVHDKSSANAGVDSGVNSVADFKKLSFLRG